MSQLPKVASYDLTTPKGMTKAVADYAKENPTMAALAAMNPLVAVLGHTIYKSALLLFEHPEKMIEAQRKTAVDIIKAGKENEVSKVRVTLNQKAGIDIGGALEGYSLKFSVGTDNNMTIEAEYK